MEYYRRHVQRFLAGAAVAVAVLCGAGEGVARPLHDDELPPDRVEQAPESFRRLTDGVTISEHLGETINADQYRFTNTSGQKVKLSDYFHHDKPVILQLGYLECPQLCGIIAEQEVKSLNDLDLQMGKDYDVLFVSIDPREQWQLAVKKKSTYTAAYNKPGADTGWHFLTGERIDIEGLSAAVGFKYKWIEDERLYTHPAMLVVLTPEGKISKYLYGVDFPKTTLRLALVDASGGKVGTLTDQLLLFCTHWDGSSGQYTPSIMRLMRLAGALTMVVIAAFLGRRYWKDYRQRRRDQRRVKPDDTDGLEPVTH